MTDALEPFAYVYNKDNVKLGTIFPTIGKQTYSVNIIKDNETREYISLADLKKGLRDKFGANQFKITYSEIN